MIADPRRVVVVGAASGIGAATAAHFYRRGDHVLAVDRRRHKTPASDYADCDLANPSEIAALLSGIGPDWDILAHVAGIPGTDPAVDVLTINYLGTRLMVEGMLSLMRRGGAIVTVGSTAALGWEQRQDALAGLLAARDAESVERWCADQDPAMSYYTSKQAVIMFTKRIAAHAWSEYGVRANVVSPGPVETPILADFESDDRAGSPRGGARICGTACDRRRRRARHRIPRLRARGMGQRPGYPGRRRLHRVTGRRNAGAPVRACHQPRRRLVRQPDQSRQPSHRGGTRQHSTGDGARAQGDW